MTAVGCTPVSQSAPFGVVGAEVVGSHVRGTEKKAVRQKQVHCDALDHVTFIHADRGQHLPDHHRFRQIRLTQ